MAAELTDPVLAFSGASLRRQGQVVLAPTDLTVRAGERWVILGPNGAGKSTLLRLASTYELPSSGTVEVLGGPLGRTPVEGLRRRIGVTSSALERLTQQNMTVRAAVATGFEGHLIDWRTALDPAQADQVTAVLARLGLTALADRRLQVISEGERRRVHLARALVGEPELLILDEPTAGLDIAGRELLVADLAALAGDTDVTAIVLVTHHVEEIPPGFTHAALMSGGALADHGPIEEVLTAGNLSRLFELDLDLSRAGGRWSARASA